MQRRLLFAAVSSVLVFRLVAPFAWSDDAVQLPNPERGERAKALVENGHFQKALELLGETGPLDFVWPAHIEIQDIDDQGQQTGRYVPDLKFADRRDLTARCQFGLGHADRAYPLVWRLLENDPEVCSDELLWSMAQSAAQRRDFDQIQRRLEALAAKESTVAGRALALVKIARDVRMQNFDDVLALLPDTTVKRDDSRPFLKVGDGAWIIRLIAADPGDWTPKLNQLIEARVRAALNPSGDPLLAVRCLGMIGDQRAVEPLIAYREVEANWGRRQVIDNALALIRTHRLMASYDDPRTIKIVRSLRYQHGSLAVRLWNNSRPKLDGGDSNQNRQQSWSVGRRWRDPQQALRIIDALARAGFFKDAVESPGRPQEDGWFLTVTDPTGKSYWQHYGNHRSPERVPQIAAMRRALEGEVAKTLDDFFQQLKPPAE